MKQSLQSNRSIAREVRHTFEELTGGESAQIESASRSLDVSLSSSSHHFHSHHNATYRSISVLDPPTVGHTFHSIPGEPSLFPTQPSMEQMKLFSFSTPTLERRGDHLPQGGLYSPQDLISTLLDGQSPTHMSISRVSRIPSLPDRPLFPMHFPLAVAAYLSHNEFLRTIHKVLYDLGLDADFNGDACCWQLYVAKEGKVVEWVMRVFVNESQQMYVIEANRKSGDPLLLNKYHQQIKRRLVGGSADGDWNGERDAIEGESSNSHAQKRRLSSEMAEEVGLPIPSLTHSSSDSSSSATATTLQDATLDLSRHVLKPLLYVDSECSSGEEDFSDDFDLSELPPLPSLTLDQVTESVETFHDMLASRQGDQEEMAASSLAAILSAASEEEVALYVEAGVLPLLLSLASSSASSQAKQLAVMAIARLSEFDAFHETLLAFPALLALLIPLAQEGSFRENEMRREASRTLANLATVFTTQFADALFSLPEGRRLLDGWLKQPASSSKDSRITMSNARSRIALQEYL